MLPPGQNVCALPNEVLIKPDETLNKEIGVKGRLGHVARVSLALFQIDTSDEIVVNSAAGGRTDYKNASKTRREGVELALESYLGAGFEAHLAYTWLDARFTQPFTSGTPALAVQRDANCHSSWP